MATQKYLYLVIHHTAGNKLAKMEDEKAEHLRQKYVDIAYNGFIEFDGTFKMGRNWNDESQDNAANSGLNDKSLSIALAGNFEEYSPSEAQIKQLIQVCASWCKKFNIPAEKIIGHNQVKDISKNWRDATLCPGKYFIPLIATKIRPEVQKYLIIKK